MALWNGANHPAPVHSIYSETKRLPILTYHRVAPQGSTSLARFRITPEDFEAQMRYLKEAGYYTITFDHWRVAAECKKPLPGRAVLITFDDGYADFAQYAWPVLKQFEMTAVVFLVSGQLGGSNVWDRTEETLQLMSAEKVQKLQDEGVIFGSHSLSHRSLLTLSSAEIAREHVRSRCTLEAALGRPVQAVSYPYGASDAVVRHLAGACGYLYGVTTRQSACRFTDSLLGLPRIEINGDDNLERFIAKLTHAD
jgi:peptidoglycan/xylan/chitin deacetylase (PgdA/CDA1 family)